MSETKRRHAPPLAPSTAEALSHDELVARALKWVKNLATIGVSELVATHGTESPDVVGWTMNGFSWLVECKASRADFARDKKKPARQHETLAMGTYRYYFCPASLLHETDLPEGWGLIWTYPNGRNYVVVEPTVNRSAQRTFREMPLVLSLLRRALLSLEEAREKGFIVEDRVLNDARDEK